MTRPPGDAFNRSFPGISSPSASSVISPLTLPRGVSGYFDGFTATGRANQDSPAGSIPGQGNFRSSKHSQVYSPLSPGVRGPAVAQATQSMSPYLMPYQTQHRHPAQQPHLQQGRSTSTSPTQHIANHARNSMVSPPNSNPASAINGLSSTSPDGMSNAPIPSISAVSAGHPHAHSTSDAAGVPAQVHMIRRLVQQNGRIREAWEAERKYMEANRERVEEVYKEERALMEEERVEWDLEKEALLRKIAMLEQQVAGLCGYSPRLTKNDVLANVHGKGRRGGGSELSPDSSGSLRSSTSSQGKAKPSQRNGSGDSGPFPSVGNAASQTQAPLQPDLEFAQHHRLPLFSPSKQPESSPFIPMMDNNSSSSSSNNSNIINHGMGSSPPKEDGTPVPTFDVQEIIPTSEGIPIKASAVQKTFSDGCGSPLPVSRPTSRTPSPPADRSNLDASPKPVKEQTLQVLAANAITRLTMHAGHTPNHSLSVLPTVTATTTSSSGETTPTLMQMVTDSSVAASSSEPSEPPATVKSKDSGVDMGDTIFELDPEEDRPLKGPLMVRNMPAHDEIFFKCLSDKLEEVSKGTEAAVPTVLRDVVEPESATDPKPEDTNRAPAGPDDAAAEKLDKDKSSPRSSDGEEIEVPLKIKKSSNFGAPFGVFR
jgi:hypothetical protein